MPRRLKLSRDQAHCLTRLTGSRSRKISMGSRGDDMGPVPLAWEERQVRRQVPSQENRGGADGTAAGSDDEGCLRGC